MGLYTDLNTALKDAFDSDLSDAVKTIDLEHKRYIYDTDSGNTEIGVTATATRGVETTVTNEMIDGEVVQARDTLFIILQSELSATPVIGDYIVSSGKEYSINSIIPDEAGVTWNITGRAT